MVLPGGGGGPGGYREGNHCLRISPFPGHLLQVPGAIFCSRERRLAASSAQSPVRQAEVGAATSGVEQGGIRYPNIGTDILGGGVIVPAIRFRYMGTDTAYSEGIVHISP